MMYKYFFWFCLVRSILCLAMIGIGKYIVLPHLNPVAIDAGRK